MTDPPYYEDTGEGQPLLLLHSGGMAHQEWHVHRDAFTDRFRVLAPDLPGHGRTPLPEEGLTVAGAIRSVVAMLEDAGVDEAHVLGSSLGGGVALGMALEEPDLVDRLVLFRVGFREGTSRKAPEMGLADPDYWTRLGMDEWLSRVHEPQGGPDAWTDVVDRAARLPETDPASHDVGPDELASLEAPTLIVAGDRDPLVPVREAVEMYEAIPQADLWIIPHATHVVAARTWRREIFATEVRRFLLGARRDLES